MPTNDNITKKAHFTKPLQHNGIMRFNCIFIHTVAILLFTSRIPSAAMVTR